MGFGKKIFFFGEGVVFFESYVKEVITYIYFLLKHPNMKSLLFYIILLISLSINPINGQNYCLPDGLKSPDLEIKSIKIGNISYNFQLPNITEGVPEPLIFFSENNELHLSVNALDDFYVYSFLDIDDDGSFKASEMIFKNHFSSGNVNAVINLPSDWVSLLENEQRSGIIAVTAKDIYDDGIYCQFPFDDIPQSIALMNWGPGLTNGPKFRISTTIASGKCLNEGEPFSFCMKNEGGQNLPVDGLRLHVENNICEDIFELNLNSMAFSNLVPEDPNNANASYMYPDAKWCFQTTTSTNCSGQTFNAYITLAGLYRRNNLPGYHFCNNKGVNLLGNNEEKFPPISKINKIFPNPTSDNTRLDFELVKKELVTIEVYDICGKLVQPILHQQELEEGVYNLELPFDQLHNGTYFILWKSGNQREMKKIVKTK